MIKQYWYTYSKKHNRPSTGVYKGYIEFPYTVGYIRLEHITRGFVIC